LNFGLGPDFSVQIEVSLSERLSERLSQKLKSPIVVLERGKLELMSINCT